MKCYISGKISGLPTEQVTAKFRQAELQIRAFGHEPVNPLYNGVDKEASWNEPPLSQTLLCCSNAMQFTCLKTGRTVKERVSKTTSPRSAVWRLSPSLNMLFFKLRV